MEVFPSEIWLAIMRRCDSVDTILCMSRSCKGLRIMFESEVRKRWTIVLGGLPRGEPVIPLELRVPFYEIVAYFRMHRQRDPMKLDQEYWGLHTLMSETWMSKPLGEGCTLGSVAMQQIRNRERGKQGYPTSHPFSLLCMCYVPWEAMYLMSVMCEYLPEKTDEYIAIFISEGGCYLTMALMAYISGNTDWCFKEAAMRMITPRIVLSDYTLGCLQQYLSHYEIWLALLSPIPSK